MCIRARIVVCFMGLFFASFNAKSIDLSNSYVTFYEGHEMSNQAFIYPIIEDKDTHKLTYLDDLILDSLRGGKLGYQYFDSDGKSTACRGTRFGFTAIDTKTTVKNLKVPSCYNSLNIRTRLCLYDKDNKYIGGDCTDSLFEQTFNALAEKPSDYRYDEDGNFDGCALNPVRIKLADVYSDSIIAPESIETFFPIGNCRSVHLESPDYKNFTSALSQKHPMTYKRLGPKCTVTDTKRVSIAHHDGVETDGTVIHPKIIPTRVGCL